MTPCPCRDVGLGAVGQLAGRSSIQKNVRSFGSKCREMQNMRGSKSKGQVADRLSRPKTENHGGGEGFHLPPLLWLLGRVTNVHPGSDGRSRVADITTRKGVITRA
ncbi:unnamed protein product [Leptidea sinapis]|uniref:DUF5641 domain-containing protein n=1 Tax=Leptidea sinapis TaxID=189913 RepID=A0A5E4R768_9NEOP|nr:unnamed protein product [Leptidea sinapis]